MIVDHNRVRELFLAATERPVSERVAYLVENCGSNAELRASIERLLAAHMNPASIVNPIVEPVESDVVASVPPTINSLTPKQDGGTLLAGRYSLLEVIGEGGMGNVWRARQNQPLKRTVAVKLIKPGMDSKAVLARFEAERQALALMDHPNIARVLDAGVAYDGRPFFVMDLVKGEPITQFCDVRKLTPRERLELFVPVCHAIQHAHQKGIIHRDIKPSNVLVALQDGVAIPKVIDFGVAKAIGLQLTEQTLNTGFGFVIGTPEYMSPEQATFNNLDVDTRSDLYSLGVLLYELLVGSPPFAKQELERAGVLEMLRVVREDEPQKPSTKLSTADALPTLAANRSTEPKKLMGILRNELDWIVLKALEKDRTRRYETANGFAADVQRYLSGEPVLAVPPSVGYRLKKVVWKYRGPVAAATLMAVSLVGGVTVSSWQAVQAMRAEEKALIAAEDARQAQLAESARAEGERNAKQQAWEAAEAEMKALAQARKRLAQIEKGNEILTSIFDDLDLRRVKDGKVPLEAVLAQRLIKAGKNLDIEAVGDDLAVASLQERLGLTLLSLGFPQDAIELFNKALGTRRARLGEDHRDTFAAMNNLGLGYLNVGKHALAIPLLEKALKNMKAESGEGHTETLRIMNNLATAYQESGKFDVALQLYKDAYRISKTQRGETHRETLTFMGNLAECYLASGDLNAALPLLEETCELMKVHLGADNRDTLSSMNHLAMGYMEAGKYELALPMLENTLKLSKASLGTDHPDTLTSMNNLAVAYRSVGKFDLAWLLFEETLKLRQARLSKNHPDTLTTMNNLGGFYRYKGMIDKSVSLLEETVGLMKASVPEHNHLLVAMHNLALSYNAKGKHNLALALFEETLKRTQLQWGDEHFLTLKCKEGLATTYADTARPELALELFEETLKLRKKKYGTYHPDTLVNFLNLALVYQKTGKLDLALPLFQEAAKGLESLLFQHELAERIVRSSIACFEQKKLFNQAEALQGKWLEAVKQQAGADSINHAAELTILGYLFLRQNKLPEAESVFRESLAIREKKLPDDWTTFYIRSQLGDILFCEKKYADAVPFLTKEHEGIKNRINKMPPESKVRLKANVEQLIRLYEATADKAEEAKWRKELETFKVP